MPLPLTLGQKLSCFLLLLCISYLLLGKPTRQRESQGAQKDKNETHEVEKFRQNRNRLLSVHDKGQVGSNVTLLRTSQYTRNLVECPLHSQHSQDEYVSKNYFQGRSKKEMIYVDIGANHPLTYSNTAYLDLCLGWKGFCIEVQPPLVTLLRLQRTCKVWRGCISNQTSKMVFLRTGARMEWKVLWRSSVLKTPFRTTSSNCTALGTFVEVHNITHIDFLDVDVEQHEPFVLAGFPDPAKVEIRVVTIEINSVERSTVQVPMLWRGYVLDGITGPDSIFVKLESLNKWITEKTIPPVIQLSSLSFLQMIKWCKQFQITSPHCTPLITPTRPMNTDISRIEQRKLPQGFVPAPKCKSIISGGRLTNRYLRGLGADWFALNNYFTKSVREFEQGSVRESTGEFVDVLPEHPFEESSSWVLEKCFGWKGICIVPPSEVEGFKKERDCEVKTLCMDALCKKCINEKCVLLNCSLWRGDAPDCFDIKSHLKDNFIDYLTGHGGALVHLLTMAPAEDYSNVRIIEARNSTEHWGILSTVFSLRQFVMSFSVSHDDFYIRREPHELHALEMPHRNRLLQSWNTKIYTKTDIPTDVWRKALLLKSDM